MSARGESRAGYAGERTANDVKDPEPAALVIPRSAATRDLLALTETRSLTPAPNVGHMRVYYVYILASRSRRLYVGVTRDLARRLAEHRVGTSPGFSRRYRIDRLVYFEDTRDVRVAIAREKQIKGWGRRKKVELIESVNAGWLDLAADWFREDGRRQPFE